MAVISPGTVLTGASVVVTSVDGKVVSVTGVMVVDETSGEAVVMAVSSEHRTGGRALSSQRGSLGWKQRLLSALRYIPKQTWGSCHVLQYEPW